MFTERILRVVLTGLFVVVLAMGCNSGSNPAGPSTDAGSVTDTDSGSGSGSVSETPPATQPPSTPPPSTPQFAVTDVSVNVSAPLSTLTCPRDVVYTLTFTITVNAPGTVGYRVWWDGQSYPWNTVTFDSAGSKTFTVDKQKTISQSESLEFKVETFQPNVKEDVKIVQATCKNLVIN